MTGTLPRIPKLNLVSQRQPTQVRANCDGSLPSQQIRVVPGMSVIMINPLTITVEVQVTFQPGEANTAGKFFTLIDGQSIELRSNSGEYFGEVLLQFFASSAVDVDVVAF